MITINNNFKISKLHGTWTSEIFDKKIYEFTIKETDIFNDENFRIKAKKTRFITNQETKEETTEKSEENILFFLVDSLLLIQLNGFGYGFIQLYQNNDNGEEIINQLRIGKQINFAGESKNIIFNKTII